MRLGLMKGMVWFMGNEEGTAGRVGKEEESG